MPEIDQWWSKYSRHEDCGPTNVIEIEYPCGCVSVACSACKVMDGFVLDTTKDADHSSHARKPLVGIVKTGSVSLTAEAKMTVTGSK